MEKKVLQPSILVDDIRRNVYTKGTGSLTVYLRNKVRLGILMLGETLIRDLISVIVI